VNDTDQRAAAVRSANNVIAGLLIFGALVVLVCACFLGDAGRIWNARQCIEQVCGEEPDASGYQQCAANCRNAYGH